ncbi:MAG: autotransporter outer membrane beta-barrel domain-containing protein [Proteobacteria bacterium]|nr:autotransporter outer membrane beta-barrel domain-containing protein [Pseudomonadota bacterium]
MWDKKISTYCLAIVFYLTVIISSAWGQFQSNIVPLASSEYSKEEKKEEKKEGAPPANKLYVWGSVNTYSTIDNFFLSRLKGQEYGGTLGADYKVLSDLKLGFYYIRRHTNSLSPLGMTTVQPDEDNYYPYLMYNFTPNFFLNVVAGYSYIATQIKRFNLSNFTPIFSKAKASRWSVYPSLTYAFVPADNWLGSFQLGYGFEYFSSDPYRESNNNRVSGTMSMKNYGFTFLDISYFFKIACDPLTSIAPYVQGGADYNFQWTPIKLSNQQVFGRGREGYTVGTGLRFYFTNDVTLAAGWQRIGGHSGQTNNVYTVLLRAGIY